MTSKTPKPDRNRKNAIRSERPTPSKTSASNGFWDRYKGFIIVAVGFYLLMSIFFAPVVFQGKVMSPAADMMAVAGMNKMGEAVVSSGNFPLWNPTLFCGLPMFASLQYALFTYPPEYIIRVLSYIFGGSHYRIWFFHYLLAGLFAYLLGRHFKLGRIASALVGLAYSFSPQLIVLVDVGHGSKLMGMVYLPLLWLLIDRLRQRPTLGRAAALGAAFAIEILALHPQVAAYGGMMMGLYLIYHGVAAFINKSLKDWGRMALLWLGALGLSLALSSVLWMSVLDYARYSIRSATTGGMTGGGVDWAYATGWSFHPLESITYIFPSWFGFAGQTYWGTVGTPDGSPFTQNPMYFGIIVLILAIFAFTTLPRRQWGFALTLALTAWILSFGRYLPVLYGPLYHLLPLFNKFRAPVMGQALLLLPMALLAGMGLQRLLDRCKEGRAWTVGSKIFLALAAVAFLKALVIQASPGFFDWFYRLYAGIVRPGVNPRVLEAAQSLAVSDAARILILIAIFAVGMALVMNRKIPGLLVAILALALTTVDLWIVNHKLVSFQPGLIEKVLFEPEGVAKLLQKEHGKFRVHPLDKNYPAVFWQKERGIQSSTDPANWLSYFGIESTTGYFGAKPGPYQKLMNVSNLDARPPYSWLLLMTRPQLLDALNVRYILTTYPLEMAFAELRKQGVPDPIRPASAYQLVLTPRDVTPGGGGFLYRNPGELPRARLTGKYRVVADFEATLVEMMQGAWNPAVETLLDRPLKIEPVPDGAGSVEIKEYKNELVVVGVNTPTPKLLVLADSYYPSGWSATIDGNPTDILRADGVLRAVAVPAGEHRVEFRFHPSWFFTGLTVSVLTGLALLAWLVSWSLRKKYRRE